MVFIVWLFLFLFFFSGSVQKSKQTDLSEPLTAAATSALETALELKFDASLLRALRLVWPLVLDVPGADPRRVPGLCMKAGQGPDFRSLSC